MRKQTLAAAGGSALLLLGICMNSTAAPNETSPMQILSPSDFQFTSQGNFAGRKDRRGLLIVEHPLAGTKAGDFGFFRTEAALPPGSTPPHILSFYATDNNQPASSDKGYMMVDQRVGHRFKQIRINGKTVWSEDTHLADSPKWKSVDITEHIPASGRFVIEAGMFEEVDSSKVLPGDIVKSPPQKAFRPRQEIHQTDSYWGDFSLRSGAAASLVLPQPQWKPGLAVRNQAPKILEPWIADAVAVENAGLIPTDWTWPALTGIPFPEGKFPEGTLLTASTGESAFPIRPLAKWPNGSIKWGLVQAALPAKFDGTFRIGLASGEASPSVPIIVQEENAAGVALASGGLKLSASPSANGPGLQISLNGKTLADDFQFYFEGETESFRVKWGRADITEQFPERATVEISGDLESPSGQRYGRIRTRITAFAETPFFRVLSTIFNETPQDPFRAKAYGWTFAVPKDSDLQAGNDWFTAGSDAGYLTGAIRYFRLLGPNGIRTVSGRIDLELFRPGNKQTPFYQTHPGEAKTHEIWLAATSSAVSAEQARQFTMLIDRPPGLAVAPLIRGSGVWGPMTHVDPESDGDLYHGLIAKEVEAYYANGKSGLRPLGNYAGFSSSFYWNALHTMYALYAMTGERKWLDRAERSARHMMDLLICHWSPDQSNVGGMYSYFSTKTPDGQRAFEPDFSNADFSIRSQNPHPAFDHWQLTGDPDGKKIAIGMADFLVTNPGMNELASAGSARHQGWALIALSRAYAETGDPRYREYGKRMLRAARNFIDPRRGAYLQFHSSVVHNGIVPFMAGILATGLRDFHEATGDPEALEILALVTGSSQEEMLDREWAAKGPGTCYYYSPNPHHRYSHSPDLNLGQVGGNAYLAALTGDPDSAKLAREGWKAFLAGPHNSPNMIIYDLPQTLFWMKSLPKDRDSAAR